MRSQIFRDFDAFAASVKDVDCKMILRNPDHHEWSVAGVDVDAIDVQLGKLGSGNIAQGQLRPDGFMFYVPLTEGVEYIANGCEVDRGGCVVMDPGSEFCISTKVAHDWAAIFVPNSKFAADTASIPLSPELDGATCRVARPGPKIVKQIQVLVQGIVTSATRSPLFETTQAARNAATDMLQAVSPLTECRMPAASRQPGRPRASREEVVRRSMEYLEQLSPTIPSVGELAKAAGVSPRTLQNAFNEYYGVGPVRYLRTRRLNQVHRALKLASCDETTVTQVLHEHGVWDLSRFARLYQHLFAELPSETLKRAGARH